MLRGEIWWASLFDPAGSSPGYRRPALIIQANEFTESRIRTVVIVALTTNLRLATAPGYVLLRRKHSRLPKDSVANVSQVLTVDKSLLTERVSLLPIRLLREIEAGLRLVLGL